MYIVCPLLYSSAFYPDKKDLKISSDINVPVVNLLRENWVLQALLVQLIQLLCSPGVDQALQMLKVVGSLCLGDLIFATGG